MADYQSSLHGFLEDPVRFKTGGGDSSNSRAKRIVQNTPEVMVKITGNTKGVTHVASHLDYISRNGKLKLETETGEIIESKEGVKELTKQWMSNRGKVNKNTRETTNIMLSMPRGTNEKALEKASREFAKKTFSHNYQYVFVLHTDAKNENPHIHLTIKNLGHDRKRLHVKKGQPQKWRESFAEELRKQGIDAEASPRAVRGVVKKGVSQIVRHIKESGRESSSDRKKVKEIINEYANKDTKEKPWEKKIKERQSIVRKTWLEAAKELNKKGDNVFSQEIVKFVKDMPQLKTERHEMKEKITKLHKENSKDAGNRDQEER
ncbi:IncQ plasmid conjugative transfer DNA nicking endonuclease TraR (pTi VirD2 homolog) [Bathymodiolus heckerae thiotrophic gill symbiont]|uniref:relaxase/mobilization nuclease domain-containing protein n=1 Tax=Bathymodiolus heckerae thiotrophic gill symbiont TaxID=1052212 RepID=UPI0010AF6F3C|nr:relaxase/mobilization nuclease domain-containing protein [Bathymodiolus heckerae thiotrophic gill symbiont]SHN92232.1 IncQ plasmid conjugative transfer DNA nicking endonuclease TraR (pTi VirD2 homolog) [Bathymodiolus heckerae thiotrophic gill symbiont]